MGVVRHDDDARVVVHVIGLEVIEPFGELDHRRHVRLVVYVIGDGPILGIAPQIQHVTVPVLARRVLSVICHIVHSQSRGVFRFLEQERLMGRVVRHHQERVLAPFAYVGDLRQVLKHAIRFGE